MNPARPREFVVDLNYFPYKYLQGASTVDDFRKLWYSPYQRCAMPQNEKNKVPVNDSFDYLRKSLNNINIQQSTGPAPIFYPKVNGQINPTPPQNQPSANWFRPKG